MLLLVRRQRNSARPGQRLESRPPHRHTQHALGLTPKGDRGASPKQSFLTNSLDFLQAFLTSFLLRFAGGRKTKVVGREKTKHFGPPTTTLRFVGCFEPLFPVMGTMLLKPKTGKTLSPPYFKSIQP